MRRPQTRSDDAKHLDPDRFGVAVLTAVTNRLWSVRANLIADVVAEHGSVRAMIWFGRNMPRYERILARWGPIRTHLVCSLLSLDDGCAYASFGHGHALQLHYFRDTGQLFPLSDDELLALNGIDRDALVGAMDQALVEAGLNRERAWILRTLEVKNGAPVESSADDDLRHLANMFSWLNTVGIQAGTELDEAHDPINKDRELRASYASTRGGSASAEATGFGQQSLS